MTTAAVLAVSHHQHQSRTTSVVQHCHGLNFFCHDSAAKQSQDHQLAIGALVVVAIVLVLVLLVRRARRKARGNGGGSGGGRSTRRSGSRGTRPYPY